MVVRFLRARGAAGRALMVARNRMIYQLSWKILPGLRGLSCSEFRAVAASAPDNEHGVAVEFASDTERDAFLHQLGEHFGTRRFINAADAFDTVKTYVVEHAAKRI